MQDSTDTMLLLFDEVLRTRGRMQTLAANFADPEGPTGLSMTVLTAVARAASPPTVPQIGRSLGYPRQTIQRHADELAARGLVRFVDNPDHKRAQRLTATKEGAAALARADARSRRWARDFTRDLDPARLAVTVETLRAIRERLEGDARSRDDAA